ncbi:MAG: helix-turn-helix domain-containing protein [Clostridiales Family XIII bacterium]|nr:helix-turn-helix domain-containing protein [Clostridiales Family XIII bacterium]
MAERGFGPVFICGQFGIGSLQTVYNWMNGRNLPSIDHLYDLSMLLTVPIDDIIVPARRDGAYSSNGMMLGLTPDRGAVRETPAKDARHGFNRRFPQPVVVSILQNGTLRVS